MQQLTSGRMLGEAETNQDVVPRSYDGLAIGSLAAPNAVVLAPMSGVSDLPFRRIADSYGAGLVVSEMVASRELAAERRDVQKRAEGAGLYLTRVLLEIEHGHVATAQDVANLQLVAAEREACGR